MLFVLLALAVTTGPRVAGGTEISSGALVGSWVLLSRVDRDADGSIVPEPNLGSDALGFLVYDQAGHVAAQLMRKARSLGAEGAPTSVHSDPSNSTATGGYDAYFGTYSLDPKLGTVTHHLVGALNPRDVGKSLLRHVAVSHGELRLWFSTVGSEGKPVTRTLVWRRAEPEP
jgi:hypothetical protein